MPKQKRWYIKRELDYAIGNLTSAQDKILAVAKPFEHVHDDWFDRFIKCVGGIQIIADVIKQLRDEL